MQEMRHLSSNRVAADDNPMKLMSIAMKPLSQPPFPLEKNRGNDRSHGRRWTVILRIKADTINPNILLLTMILNMV